MISSVTPSDVSEFRELFPEITSQSDQQITVALEEALYYHNENRQAWHLAGAHLLTAGEKREVIEEQVGNVRLRFRSTKINDKNTFWQATKYGRRFIALEERLNQFSVRVL